MAEGAASSDAAGGTAGGAGRKLLRANGTAVQALMLCCLCRNFGIMVRMQTETQMWLNAFAGDYAGQARFQGNLESAAGILGFAITPVLAGLSDAIGRRPLMIASPCFSVLSNILIVARPTVGSLAVRRLLMPLSSTPWHSGEAAALADLFKGDPAALATGGGVIHTPLSTFCIENHE